LHYSSPREAVKVHLIAMLLGSISGLWFVAPELEPSVEIGTSIAMLITYAVICRVLAAQQGRDANRWGIAGLLGGVVTTAVLLALIPRGQE
jgi:hypothetical protein